MPLSPEEYELYRGLLTRDLERLRQALGIHSVLARPISTEERMRVARETVDSFVARAIRTRRGAVTVPPMVAAVLRSDSHWKLHYGGLNRAMERAAELRAARDSTTQ